MKRILALQLLACLAIWSADANTITSQTLPFAGGEGAFANVLHFTKFDTSLGTLTGVTISMTATGYGTLTVQNTSGNSVSFYNAHADVPVLVEGPDGLTISTTLQSGNFGTPGSRVDAPPNVTTSYNGSSGTLSALGSVLSGNLSLYSGLGGGLFDVTASPGDASSSGTETGGGHGYLLFGASETVSGTVKVEFTYTAVPDGGLTAMLLGMGMLALGTVRRMVK